MSDKGGSDLDVFENLSKAPAPARKSTLVGLAVPPAPGPAPSSSARGSLPPPPPPSLRPGSRPSAAPPPPNYLDEVAALDAEDDEIEEVDAVEDASSPLAAPAPTSAAAALGAPTRPQVEAAKAVVGAPKPPASAFESDADPFAIDDATRVFSADRNSSLDASEDAPTPYQPKSSPFSVPAPLPAPPTSRSSLPVPAPSPSRPSAPLPPPTLVSLRGTSSAPPPGSAAPAAVTDWEEEDDKTAVFSRESGFDAAHLLMGRLPDAPPPPMSRPSAPIPTAPVVAMPSTRPPLRIESSPASVPPISPNRSLLVWGAAAAAVLATALFLLLRPTTGGLVVTVAGPASKPLDKVEVLLNGKTACKSSPCSLKDLAAGTHMVRARAEGYQETAETAVLVTGGQDAVHNIRLAPEAGSGVRVTSQSPGLRLYVDDKDIGPLPQELKDLSPGMHTLRVSSEQFETWQKQVTVNEGQVLDIELPKLKVIKGLAVIKGGENSDGAKVVLDSGGDRRALPSLPISLHIDTSKTNTLTASKRGYDSFEAELVFEPGTAEKTFEISLAEPQAPAAAAPRPYTRRPARSPDSSEATESGSGTLNINSIPASNILLDGRPVGTTPKVGLSVSAGRHTVVFVADGKRASKSVKVAAGQSVTVAHRFK